MRAGRLMHGTGARLLAAVHDADDRIKAIQAEWDTLPRMPAGGIPQDIRDAYYTRRHRAEAEREAVASQLWGYFEGPPRGHYDGPGQPTAEERAAWTLLTHWRYRQPGIGRG